MPFSFLRPTWLPGALLFGETHKWGKNNAFTRILETRQSNLMFHLKMTLIKHLNNNLYKGRRARGAEILRWWRSCCDRSARDGKLQRIYFWQNPTFWQSMHCMHRTRWNSLAGHPVCLFTFDNFCTHSSKIKVDLLICSFSFKPSSCVKYCPVEPVGRGHFGQFNLYVEGRRKCQ